MTEQLDLKRPGVPKALSKDVLRDIDKAAQEMHDDGPRKHLGASIIGDVCSRKLWYSFRWIDYKVHDGRQLRLFNRGHLEESRFVGWLRHAGYTVFDTDPATGQQWRISGVGGHFGGSMDGQVILPEKYGYSKKLLLEFKTNGTGAGFNKLLTDGCAIAKPQHFDQQCVYGYQEGIEYSLYLNVCKNDDNIHSEIVKLDLRRGEELEKKAALIILAFEPPARISENPAYFACKYCDFAETCHFGKKALVNCRSCKYAEPQENKVWFCHKYNAPIPTDEDIKRGCGLWESIA